MRSAAPPPTFFHGTRKPFAPGGLLLPVDITAQCPRAGNRRTDVVYVTTDRSTAEWYARQGKGRGRPRVLTVAPLGQVTADPSPYDEEDDQYVCEAARVLASALL